MEYQRYQNPWLPKQILLIFPLLLSVLFNLESAQSVLKMLHQVVFLNSLSFLYYFNQTMFLIESTYYLHCHAVNSLLLFTVIPVKNASSKGPSSCTRKDLSCTVPAKSSLPCPGKHEVGLYIICCRWFLQNGTYSTSLFS